MKSPTSSRLGGLPCWTACAVLVVAASTACVQAPVSRATDASAAEVEAAFRRFEEAWEREDLQAAAGAFTPDAVVFDPVPPGRFEKSEGIRAWVSGSFDALEHISISASQLRTQTMGPVAWSTGHFVFEALQNGKPFRAEGDMTLVWMRQTDGSYKLSVFHASHLPVPISG